MGRELTVRQKDLGGSLGSWQGGMSETQPPAHCLSVCNCPAHVSDWKQISSTSKSEKAVIGGGQGRVTCIAGDLVHSHLSRGRCFYIFDLKLHFASMSPEAPSLSLGSQYWCFRLPFALQLWGWQRLPNLISPSLPPHPQARVCSSQTWGDPRAWACALLTRGTWVWAEVVATYRGADSAARTVVHTARGRSRWPILS